MPLFNRQLSTDQEASVQAHPWHFGAQQPEAMPLPHLTLPADCIFFLQKHVLNFPLTFDQDTSSSPSLPAASLVHGHVGFVL